MAWTTDELLDSNPLPFLQLDKDQPVRIRILAPQIAPAIPTDSIYANGTWDKAKHFPPDEVKLVIGGSPVDCIGIRNACIFHEGLLDWGTTYDNLINVVVYEGVNAKDKTYTNSFILGFNMKLSLWKNMAEQLGLLGFEKNQLWAVDWIIVKTGEGRYNTKYNCTAISAVLEEEIVLAEFPAQEEYADSDLPMMIDFRKLNLNPLTTPQQQEEWYNNAQAKAINKSAEEFATAGQTPKPNPKVMSLPTPNGLPNGLPPGLKNVTHTATANVQAVLPVKQITMQSGEEPKKRGRPPGTTKNTMIPVAQLNPTITQAPQVKAPPAIGKLNSLMPTSSNAKAAYDNACVVLDPWGVALKDSEYLQFIVDATPEQHTEYGLSAEIIVAAKLVKAGPPPAPVVQPIAPTLVKSNLPGLPKLPGQGLPVQPVVVATEVSDLDTYRATLTKLLMSLPVFKNPANIMQFLKLFFPEGDIRTVRQITEVDTITQIIEFAEQGNEAVAEAIGVLV